MAKLILFVYFLIQIYDVEEILIDYHSITSVKLLKLLLKDFYKTNLI